MKLLKLIIGWFVNLISSEEETSAFDLKHQPPSVTEANSRRKDEAAIRKAGVGV